MRRLWVLLVWQRGGQRFAPEIYQSELAISREAERWTWFLSGGDSGRVRVAGEHHWTVARTHVQFYSIAFTPSFTGHTELWVGVLWSTDGRPEHLNLCEDKTTALDWGHGGRGTGAVSFKMLSNDHFVISSMLKWSHTERLYTLHRAKVVAPYDALIDEVPTAPDLPIRYEVNLVATYTHVMNASLEGDPGLDDEQLRDLIDRTFPHLQHYGGAVVDFSWDLEEVSEDGKRREPTAPGDPLGGEEEEPET